ncbi:MAG TPA: GNAT family N-acetyltransferase [Thermomicrobiales bacterium]|nr:GNAT family N-acetyltransferase [Thermomicrobiales bacterium]
MQDVIDIVDNREQDRYEARIDGDLVGFAEYKLTPDLVVFTHTEVEPRCEGKGVGSALAKFALDDTRDQGIRKVLPLCPFIKAWIARNPTYIDLVFSRPKTTAKD